MQKSPPSLRKDGLFLYGKLNYWIMLIYLRSSFDLAVQADPFPSFLVFCLSTTTEVHGLRVEESSVALITPIVPLVVQFAFSSLSTLDIITSADFSLQFFLIRIY